MDELTSAEQRRVIELLEKHGIELPDGSYIMRSSWDMEASAEDHALMDRVVAIAMRRNPRDK